MKNCPQCKKTLKRVDVDIWLADNPVTSYQCGSCGYFEFEKNSAERALSEIHRNEAPLRMKQKIIKLSADRLGMYINKDVARSLSLKGGEEVYVSVPDKKQILIELG